MSVRYSTHIGQQLQGVPLIKAAHAAMTIPGIPFAKMLLVPIALPVVRTSAIVHSPTMVVRALFCAWCIDHIFRLWVLLWLL